MLEGTRLRTGLVLRLRAVGLGARDRLVSTLTPVPLVLAFGIVAIVVALALASRRGAAGRGQRIVGTATAAWVCRRRTMPHRGGVEEVWRRPLG